MRSRCAAPGRATRRHSCTHACRVDVRVGCVVWCDLPDFPEANGTDLVLLAGARTQLVAHHVVPTHIHPSIHSCDEHCCCLAYPPTHSPVVPCAVVAEVLLQHGLGEGQLGRPQPVRTHHPLSARTIPWIRPFTSRTQTHGWADGWPAYRCDHAL